MIYELIICHIEPGKMESIHRRFSLVTLELFRKHNLKVIDFWEDAEERERLYYIVEHESMESRNANFEAFQNDPQWFKAKYLSEINGPLVEKVESFFMRRVPYSPARIYNKD